MTIDRQSHTVLVRCAKYTAAVIGFWTIWCILMATWPQIFAHATIRALARVSIVFLPAVIFYFRGNRKKSIIDYFLLRENWLRGILLGGGIAILYFSVDWLRNFDARLISFHIPIGFSIWFNFIFGSPLAEEMFFRGVLLQELRTIIGTTRATLISAFAFSLLHLPQWLLLDHLHGFELISLFGSIFMYGIIFAVFVNLTRSLWAALLPHWINNFILLAISQ